MRFIGISQRIVENSDYVETREALSMEWGDFFVKELANYIPLPLSYNIPFEVYAKRLGRSLRGVILSGGNDLYSVNQNPISKIRDDYERDIIAYCNQESLPLLGVCRGAQRIAEYFGGTLRACNGHIGLHSIVFNNKSYDVNSFHNYCIESPGEMLEILAYAEDRSIEAFIHKNQHIFGIMWHIERRGGMECAFVFKEWKQKLKD